MRNTLIHLRRSQGWSNIADAVRETAASVQRDRLDDTPTMWYHSIVTPSC